MSERIFERAVRDWLDEGSDRTPRHAIDAVLLAVKTTPQQRVPWIPRRFTTMPTYLRLAAGIAIVAVLGVGAVTFIGPGPDVGGRPTPLPTSSPPPTAAPAPSPVPTTYVPGALTQTFTSDRHGFSLSYPEGWVAQEATEPWTEGDPPVASDPSGDKLLDGAALRDHLFLTVVSRPLDGASLDAWLTGYLDGCTSRKGGTIAGADRVLRFECVADGTDLALASSGGRGYVFHLRASGDDIELQALDTAALLDAILATVQLLPEDAVDE